MPKFRQPNFFPQILFRKSLDIMVSYYHVQHQKKTDDPILRKLGDERTDGQTDESDFIGCCLTNVERPKKKIKSHEIFEK